MTRRERLLRIIENFGGTRNHIVHFHLKAVIARMGLDALTDEAIEALTHEIVSSHRRQQRYNRENRARIAKAMAS